MGEYDGMNSIEIEAIETRKTNNILVDSATFLGPLSISESTILRACESPFLTSWAIAEAENRQAAERNAANQSPSDTSSSDTTYYFELLQAQAEERARREAAEKRRREIALATRNEAIRRFEFLSQKGAEIDLTGKHAAEFPILASEVMPRMDSHINTPKEIERLVTKNFDILYPLKAWSFSDQQKTDFIKNNVLGQRPEPLPAITDTVRNDLGKLAKHMRANPSFNIVISKQALAPWPHLYDFWSRLESGIQALDTEMEAKEHQLRSIKRKLVWRKLVYPSVLLLAAGWTFARNPEIASTEPPKQKVAAPLVQQNRVHEVIKKKQPSTKHKVSAQSQEPYDMSLAKAEVFQIKSNEPPAPITKVCIGAQCGIEIPEAINTKGTWVTQGGAFFMECAYDPCKLLDTLPQGLEVGVLHSGDAASYLKPAGALGWVPIGINMPSRGMVALGYIHKSQIGHHPE